MKESSIEVPSIKPVSPSKEQKYFSIIRNCVMRYNGSKWVEDTSFVNENGTFVCRTKTKTTYLGIRQILSGKQVLALLAGVVLAWYYTMNYEPISRKIVLEMDNTWNYISPALDVLPFLLSFFISLSGLIAWIMVQFLMVALCFFFTLYIVASPLFIILWCIQKAGMKYNLYKIVKNHKWSFIWFVILIFLGILFTVGIWVVIILAIVMVTFIFSAMFV